MPRERSTSTPHSGCERDWQVSYVSYTSYASYGVVIVRLSISSPTV